VNRPAQPIWYSLVALLVSMFVLAVAGVVYTRHVQHESERKWCSLISTLDAAYQSQPPQTQLGRNLAADMARLRRQLRC
jgi:hypothetical protein